MTAGSNVTYSGSEKDCDPPPDISVIGEIISYRLPCALRRRQRLDTLLQQPARDCLRVKANHRTDTKRWNLPPFCPAQDRDFRHTEQLRQLACIQCPVHTSDARCQRFELVRRIDHSFLQSPITQTFHLLCL